MVLLIIIGLKRLKVVIIKLSFICFYFLFFSMKSKTHACICSEPVEKWFGLRKIQALDFLENSNLLSTDKH